MIKILQGNCIDKLKELDDQSVQCVVTSPPYWGLRDYGTATWEGGDENCEHLADRSKYEKNFNDSLQSTNTGTYATDIIGKWECPKCKAVRIDDQLGLEETPQEYVQSLVNVFKEVKRVLKDDGTVWLNLGDSYAGTGHKGDSKDPKHPEGRNAQKVALNHKVKGLKSKDLVGIPWRVAFALQDDGWYLRQDIIWAKPNPMPESVKDRCTKSHEYIFLLTKKPKYYYDTEPIREDVKESNKGFITARARTASGALGGENQHNMERRDYEEIKGANKRDVWTITTKPYSEAHFATFPTDIPEICIKASSKEGDTVLDMFAGAGTTGLVADRLGRDAVLIELNPEYVKIIEDRIRNDAPMFVDIEK
tara:strand:- start:1383 stop:2474 length:1092 start_codon:yes stop_codon:yes gene_type:complete